MADLQDTFVNDTPAPLAGSRVADIIGAATIRDSASRWSILNGELQPNGATVANNDPGYNQAAGAVRAAGYMLKARVKRVSAYGTDALKLASPAIGFFTTAGGTNFNLFAGLLFLNNGRFNAYSQNVSVGLSTPDADGSDTYFELGIILRSAGYIGIVNGKIAFVSSDGNFTPAYATIASVTVNRHPPAIDSVQVNPLNAPWDVDYGVASYQKTTPAANDTFTHEADCWITFQISTLPSSGNIELLVRRTDDNNCYRIRVASSGTVTVDLMVAGAPTLKCTLTNCQALDWISVYFDFQAERITRERPGGGAHEQSGIGSSSLYTANTSGKVSSLGTGGAIANLAAWPRVLSGAAKTEYDRPIDLGVDDFIAMQRNAEVTS